MVELKILRVSWTTWALNPITSVLIRARRDAEKAVYGQRQR